MGGRKIQSNENKKEWILFGTFNLVGWFMEEAMLGISNWKTDHSI